jgi:hypothetical protein
VGKSLDPLQLGCGAVGGSHCMEHAVRTGVMLHADPVTIQIDCKKAFNSIYWSAMLGAVTQQASSLVPLATWMYREASPRLISGAEHR